MLQGVPKKVVPRFFYSFSLITLVVLGCQRRYLCLWKVEISVLILSRTEFYNSVWELNSALIVDGSHELEVLLVPLISHCKAVSLLRSKLLSRHG